MDNPQQQPEAPALWERSMAWVTTSRYIVPFLFFLGLLRAGFGWLAYAPADGADGMKYYLYGAFISGIPLHPLVSELSPLYPFFIYIHRYVLGNFDLILITQFLMSASLGVIYYLGLRRFHSILALIVALVVIGDMQTALNFNFTSTEPLYIFLLAITFAFSMQLRQDNSLRRGLFFAVATGISLALLNQTRTVATLIIVPVVILAIIQTRSWQQILGIFASYGLTLLLFLGFLSGNGVSQDGSANQIMFFNFFNRAGTLTEVADESSSTYELQQLMQTCEDVAASSTTLFDCMQEELGGQAEVTTVIQEAYIESATQQLSSFVTLLYDNTTLFLKMSGHQFFEPERSPADAQCEDIVARHERNIAFFNDLWAGVEITNTQQEALETTSWDFNQQMCPPSKTIPEFQGLAWYISFRYRSISRPNPYLWYGLLLLLIFVVPRLRKLWYPIFMAGGLLAYHALISAVVLNVQPRYVVVTNPFKIILVFALIVLVIEQIIRFIHKRVYAK